MNLDKNSNLARLYRWFYCTDDMPGNLCAYFWRLVIMIILVVPSFIVSLPYVIVSYFKEEADNENNILVGIFIYIGLYLLFALGVSVSFIFINYEKDSFMYITSFIGIAVVVSTILALSLSYRDKYLRRRKTKKKDPNLIKEFIRAKKNKYCPRIDWD